MSWSIIKTRYNALIMFTGIIEAVGQIESLTRNGLDMSIALNTGQLCMEDVALGDSIAVNGVCLTVTRKSTDGFEADISAESLRYTNFSSMGLGSKVNLEKALTLSTRLGGHLVSGHVDGIGSIVEVRNEGRSLRYRVRCSAELMRYVAAKGSITIDGVSLTVTGLEDDGFYLNIVPHTASNTIIPSYEKGVSVHVEVDVMARYAERLLQAKSEHDKSPLDRAFLAKHGY